MSRHSTSSATSHRCFKRAQPRLPAFPIMAFGDHIRLSVAIIAVSPAIAAADRAVFAGAERAHFDAGSRRIGGPACAGHGIAPETVCTLKTGDAATQLAFLRGASAICEGCI